MEATASSILAWENSMSNRNRNSRRLSEYSGSLFTSKTTSSMINGIMSPTKVSPTIPTPKNITAVASPRLQPLRER